MFTESSLGRKVPYVSSVLLKDKVTFTSLVKDRVVNSPKCVDRGWMGTGGTDR